MGACEQVSPKMKVEDLRKVIKAKCGILPGVQKLAYAGKNFEDANRTLEHYGVAYWSKKVRTGPGCVVDVSSAQRR